MQGRTEEHACSDEAIREDVDAVDRVDNAVSIRLNNLSLPLKLFASDPKTLSRALALCEEALSCFSALGCLAVTSPSALNSLTVSAGSSYSDSTARRYSCFRDSEFCFALARWLALGLSPSSMMIDPSTFSISRSISGVSLAGRVALSENCVMALADSDTSEIREVSGEKYWGRLRSKGKN